MVGDLYKEGDHRRDGAFTIFYMGINLGSLLAGVICGAAATAYGWQSRLRQRRYRHAALPGRAGHHGPAFPWRHRPCARRPACRPAALKGAKSALTKQEVDRIKVILVLGLFTIIFWAGFGEQAGGLMNLYAQGIPTA